MSDNVLSLLEHIDDDAINYEHPIKLVRIDDDEEAKERGFLNDLVTFPTKKFKPGTKIAAMPSQSQHKNGHCKGGNEIYNF